MVKITKEILQDLYKQGLSMTAIAKELNVSYVTISRYSRKFGLKPNYLRNNKPKDKPTVCSKCGETDPSQFTYNLYNICRKCNGKKSKEHNLKRRLKFLELMGNKCEICGYDKYYGALEFHHRDMKEKSKDINHQSLTQCKTSLILEELKKCILVCSNCHREIHAGLIVI